MTRPHLTPRVRCRIEQATKLVANGYKHREVAETLGVRITSVEWWRRAHTDVWNAALAAATAGNSETPTRPVPAATPSLPVRSVQTLTSFLEGIYLPSRIEVCKGYVEALQISVRKFSRWLGRDALLADLTEQAVCGHLANYRQKWTARATNNQRAHLITLWLAAFDYDLLPAPPRTRRIRKLKTNPDPPVAWNVQEVGQLLAHVEHCRGRVGGIPAQLWWGALFRVVYWTGSRIAALLAVETSCYRPGEGVLVRATKNKTPQWYPLPKSCCDAIDATEPRRRRLLFPYHKHPKTIFVDARRIIEAAGLDCPRGKGMGLFHRLRRTNISYCAAVDSTIAMKQAGHVSYETTARFYVDPRIARGRSAADILPEPLNAAVLPKGGAV